MGFKPRRFRTRVAGNPGSNATGIEVPFDPREAFGKARAPVVVTIGRHSYRTTTAIMGGRVLVPLSKANREAAGVVAGQAVDVTMAVDDAPRVVEAPADLVRALKAAGALDRWSKLSFTHQREHVEAIEGAVKPETRARRIERCVAMVAG